MFDELFLFGSGSFDPANAHRNWLMLSDDQKRQHLLNDSTVTERQIKLILKVYGEEALIKEEDYPTP